MLAAVRLRAGKAGSGRGAAGIVVEAINTAKKAGATNILVRGDSAYGSNSDVIVAVINTGARFPLSFAKLSVALSPHYLSRDREAVSVFGAA